MTDPTALDGPASSESGTTFDAVVVGARCAGSSLAVRLARGGWRVAVVDKARFPSDTLSTHVIFPDGVARLDDLGVLKRLERRHDLAPARYSWRVLGHEVAGSFTPVGGHDRALSVRRVSLDAALVELAEEGGATMLLDRKVTGLVGSGTDRDPVRGVMLDDGRELRARWVLGADGQRSSVAHHLGLQRVEERRGELAMLLGYWRGLPASDWIRLDMHERSAFMAAPCEDGIHLLTVAGPADLTRGTPAAIEARYRQALLDFPAVLNPRLLEAAELVSPVVGAPETMMRGYYRSADGPRLGTRRRRGALQAPDHGPGHRRRPGPGRVRRRGPARRRRPGGVRAVAGRAVHRGLRVLLPRGAAARAADRGTVRRAGSGPGRRPAVPGHVHPTDRGCPTCSPASGPGAGGRRRRTRTACAGWSRLVDGLSDRDLRTRVPACPLWSVHDLVAHLCGVAEDSTHGRFFDGAAQAWADPELAAQREAWTAGQVEARRGLDRHQLVAELERHGQALVRALRRGDTAATDVPAWMLGAPVTDLAAHLGDLREALVLPPETETLIARYGFAQLPSLAGRAHRGRGLAPLRLADHSDPASAWVLGGEGEPGASLEADGYQLFRAISGRRRLEDVRSWSWRGDPSAYLPLLSPYPQS